MAIAELIRQSVLERIEDECNLRAYEKALAEFQNNPRTYGLNEIEEELGLS